jgi:hypothetical protein
MRSFKILGTTTTIALLAGSAAWGAATDSPAAAEAMPFAADVSNTPVRQGTVRVAQAPGAPTTAGPARTAPGQPPVPGATTPPAPGAPTQPRPAGAGATAPPTPPPAAPTATAAAAGANMNAAAESASLGQMNFSDTPVMLGDMAPFNTVHQLIHPGLGPPPSPIPGQPPGAPTPSLNQNRAAAGVPWIRGFKIADNMSPRPQDRVFFTFDFFNDLNGAVNQRLGNQVTNIQVYRYIFGFEKTFLDGTASIGIRMPLDTLSANSQIRGLGGTTTAVDNLTVFTKFVLWQDFQTGSLVSAGFAVTPPTGPSRFAGAPSSVGFRDTQLQPYIGYIWKKGRTFIQGFEAIDVPTLSSDVTVLYNDVGIGYFLYQAPSRDALITAVVPVFETHVNVPLNHRGAFRFNDPAGTPDVVDLTFGLNFIMGRRAVFTAGIIDPVTGPKPFDLEVTALVNVFFGNTRNFQQSQFLPVIGQ